MLSRDVLKALRKYCTNEKELEIAKQYCEEIGYYPHNESEVSALVIYAGESSVEKALDDLVRGQYDEDSDENEVREFREYVSKRVYKCDKGILFDVR